MLYCISANYTPKAMQAMAKNPNTNRRDAVEKLVTAAGGKLVAMYGGPSAGTARGKARLSRFGNLQKLGAGILARPPKTRLGPGTPAPA